MAFPDDSQLVNYTGYGIDNEYTLEEGLCILPLATPGPVEGESPVAIIRLYNPYRIRKMKWAANKTGNPPVIPSPVTPSTGEPGNPDNNYGNSYFTFLGGTLNLALPTINNSAGGFNWGASGEYLYVETVPSNPDDGFVIGSYPAPGLVQVLGTSVYGSTVPLDTTGAVVGAGIGP